MMRTTKPKVVDGYLVGQKPGNLVLTPGLCLVYEGAAYHVVSESRVRRTANGWGYYTMVTLHAADGREIVVPDSILRRKGRLAGGPFDLGIVYRPHDDRHGACLACGCEVHVIDFEPRADYGYHRGDLIAAAHQVCSRREHRELLRHAVVRADEYNGYEAPSDEALDRWVEEGA